MGFFTNWWNDHTMLISVAEQAIDDGELVHASDVLDFFEKPWHYPELHENWERANAKGGGE